MAKNAIVGQSGGPSSVINCSAYGVIKTGLENPNITKVYGAFHGIRRETVRLEHLCLQMCTQMMR